MAMLEGVAELTPERLNTITQAWVEQDYHRNVHAEIATTPLKRYPDAPNVGRPCPDSETLRRAFRLHVQRRQRRSDGTISLEGKRFEVPARFRHLGALHVAYARWDPSTVALVDPHSGQGLCPLHPLDKAANASGERRRLVPVSAPEPIPATGTALPPLLRKLLAEYAATGLPPACLCPNTTTRSPPHEQDPARPLRAQIQSLLPGAAHGGAPYHTARGAVLLAHRARPDPRRGLCLAPGRSRHRQERGAAPAR